MINRILKDYKLPETMDGSEEAKISNAKLEGEAKAACAICAKLLTLMELLSTNVDPNIIQQLRLKIAAT